MQFIPAKNTFDGDDFIKQSGAKHGLSQQMKTGRIRSVSYTHLEETIRDAEQVVAELRIQEEKTAKKVEARKVTTADLLQIPTEKTLDKNNCTYYYNSIK